MDMPSAMDMPLDMPSAMDMPSAIHMPSAMNMLSTDLCLAMAQGAMLQDCNQGMLQV